MWIPSWQVTIDGLTPGNTYRLQLLFQEGCCNSRYADITLDGVQLQDEMLYPSTGAPGQAVVEEFTATGTSALVEFPYASTPGDHNATLSAFTVEALVAEPASFALLGLGALPLRRRPSKVGRSGALAACSQRRALSEQIPLAVSRWKRFQKSRSPGSGLFSGAAALECGASSHRFEHASRR